MISAPLTIRDRMLAVESRMDALSRSFDAEQETTTMLVDSVVEIRRSLENAIESLNRRIEVLEVRQGVRKA